MVMARILKPAKTAMSSARGLTKDWVLEFEQAAPRRAEPLMGWISAPDTLNQIRLKFPTLEAAKAYAEANGLTYTVIEPHTRSLKINPYADNFRADRIR